MKDFINAVKNVSEEVTEGRLNTNTLTGIPDERFDTDPYKIHVSFDILGMNTIDKINTVIIVTFIVLSYFFFNTTGVVVFLSLMAAAVLWAFVKYFRRVKKMLSEEYIFKALIDKGGYKIESPYIIATNELAKSKFKDVIIFTHYLFDNTLYSSMKNSPKSFFTSMVIITLAVTCLLYLAPSYGIAYAFIVYFASRIAFEVIRLRVVKLSINLVHSLYEAANNPDEPTYEVTT